MTLDTRSRWMALGVLCLGNLMIVLDTTIVNVALPSIRDDLGFSESSLAWVVNAYLLTFGGFLLLGGRLGDLFGHRRLFLTGIAAFTAASVACGLAGSQTVLVAARAVQGLGGAVVSAVALSLVMTLFTEPAERAKAMGVIGFVAAGGGSVGVLLGGVLTDTLDWHWIFLVNVPIGVAVYALSPAAAARGLGRPPPAAARRRGCRHRHRRADARGVRDRQRQRGRLDLRPDRSACSPRRRAALLVFLVGSRPRVAAPLVPLGSSGCATSRSPTSSASCGPPAMFAWFFLSALYLQLVLGYSPLQVGLAFLPAQPDHGRLLARSVGEAGHALRDPRRRWRVGLLLAAVGLLLFARAPVDGSFVVDVLPAMLLLGFGAGMAFNPVLLAAMSDVEPQDAGLASGVVNTSFMMGGALGLAVLASLAAARTGDAHRRGGAGSGRAHRRLPRRVPHRCGVRRRSRRARRDAAADPRSGRPAGGRRRLRRRAGAGTLLTTWQRLL